MAVYTHVEPGQLEKFLKHYDIGHAMSFKGLVEGVENSNYFLATEKGEFILTLYEQRVKLGDLPFFMTLLEHLSAKGFPCPCPVKNRDGQGFSTLAERPAALFPFLRGVSTNTPNTRHCRQVGATMAQMHLACDDFPKPWRSNSMGAQNWHFLFAQCRDSVEDIASGLTEEIIQILAAVDAEWPLDLPRGICHADLFSDNVLFADDHIGGVIDFYFACEEFFIYDLAVAINAWSISPFGSFYYSNSHALIAGYQKHRTITTAERNVFILMLRASAIRFLLTRLFDWINTPKDAVVKRKDPMEYVRALRFHLKQDSPTFYGFE